MLRMWDKMKEPRGSCHLRVLGVGLDGERCAGGTLMQPSEASSVANLRTSGIMQRTPADKAVSMGSSLGPSQPSASAAGPEQ